MPKIPQVTRRVVPSGRGELAHIQTQPGLPEGRAAARLGQTLQAIGGQFGDLASKVLASQIRTEVSNAQLNYDTSYSTFITELQKDTDYRGWGEKFNKWHDIKISELSQQKLVPASQQYISMFGQDRKNKNFTKVELQSWSNTIQAEKTALQSEINDITRTQDPAQALAHLERMKSEGIVSKEAAGLLEGSINEEKIKADVLILAELKLFDSAQKYIDGTQDAEYRNSMNNFLRIKRAAHERGTKDILVAKQEAAFNKTLVGILRDDITDPKFVEDMMLPDEDGNVVFSARDGVYLLNMMKRRQTVENTLPVARANIEQAINTLGRGESNKIDTYRILAQHGADVTPEDMGRYIVRIEKAADGPLSSLFAQSWLAEIDAMYLDEDGNLKDADRRVEYAELNKAVSDILIESGGDYNNAEKQIKVLVERAKKSNSFNILRKIHGLFVWQGGPPATKVVLSPPDTKNDRYWPQKNKELPPPSKEALLQVVGQLKGANKVEQAEAYWERWKGEFEW